MGYQMLFYSAQNANIYTEGELCSVYFVHMYMPVFDAVSHYYELLPQEKPSRLMKWQIQQLLIAMILLQEFHRKYMEAF